MKILVAGDFCPHGRVSEILTNPLSDMSGGGKNILSKVKDIILGYDYSIVNFECPIYTSVCKPINKIGPNLRCNENSVDLLKWAGFKCVTLANNHFLDYGRDGVINTINALKGKDIDFVGGGLDLHEASKILYKTINGERLAIINCCEHEFSIATETTAGSNPLNPIRQYYDINEARNKADIVLVIVHGGNEHYQLPSPRMKELYRFFIDSGADAVVNHHQHCYSGYELYKSKPIFFGLGNFCFDHPMIKNGLWNKGFMVAIDTAHDFTVIPYRQCGTNPEVDLMNDIEIEEFNKEIKCLNEVINEDELLQDRYNQFLANNSNLREVFAPYTNRLTSFLCRHKILPSFITKKKRTEILAYIQCESHIPKVLNYLKR